MSPLFTAALLSCAAPEHAAPALPAARAEEPAWACPFGPVLAGAVLQPDVKPGRYTVELSSSQDALPTMERAYTHGVHAAAWLDLGDDGRFEACLGVDETQTASVSEYASHDGQPHRSRTQNATLLHLRGAWAQRYDGARLSVDRVGWGDCAQPAEQMSPYGAVPLVCGSLPASPPLPVATLGCRALGHLPSLETAGLELGASRRAGAWALRFPPMDRGEPDPAPACGPWLLFGAEGGLTVRVEEGPRDEGPSRSFSAGARALDPAEFQPTQP